MKQVKQSEWYEQWSILQDDELFLFQEWIYPSTLDEFKDKEVLECGCGGGQHTSFIAKYSKSVTAVDLNTVELARKRNEQYKNIEFVEDDIASMQLNKKFDIVFSIGVIHHTNNPDKTVENLITHVKPGGKIIIWVYSKEGNFLVNKIIETLRKKFLVHLKRNNLLYLSKMITLTMYVPIYSIYLLPLKILPYYEYFQNFRKLSFYRNTLNVFDKLNAPQVTFISFDRAKSWLDEKTFKNIHVSSYKGVSWRISGEKL